VLRILIVEDEPFIALDLEAAVEAAHHRVAAVEDNKIGALACASRGACDVALVDMRLKDGFTGPAVAAGLKEAGIPFAIVTGNSEQLPSDRLGAAGVVGKPFSPMQIQAILELLEKAYG
jgi:CheY-like chemotaxis protein